MSQTGATHIVQFWCVGATPTPTITPTNTVTPTVTPTQSPCPIIINYNFVNDAPDYYGFFQIWQWWSEKVGTQEAVSGTLSLPYYYAPEYPEANAISARVSFTGLETKKSLYIKDETTNTILYDAVNVVSEDEDAVSYGFNAEPCHVYTINSWVGLVEPTPTPTMTITPTVTPTVTTSVSTTPGASATPDPMVTPSLTVSPTVTPSVSASPTPSISQSATPTMTPSVSASATPTVPPTNTPTPSVSTSVPYNFCRTYEVSIDFHSGNEPRTVTYRNCLNEEYENITLTYPETAILCSLTEPTGDFVVAVEQGVCEGEISPTRTPTVTPTLTPTPSNTPVSTACGDCFTYQVFNTSQTTQTLNYTDCYGNAAQVEVLGLEGTVVCACSSTWTTPGYPWDVSLDGPCTPTT